MSAANLHKITTLLKKYKRRIRFYDGWLLIQNTLWIPLAIILLLQIIGRIWPISNIMLLSVITASIWLGGIIIFSLIKPLSTLRTAWRVDQSLATKERISSAVTFDTFAETHPGSSQATLDLISLQRSDALSALRSYTPNAAFKLRWRSRPLILAAVLLIFAVVSVLLPNPMDALIAERAAAAEAARAEAERIDELRQEIAESEQLSEQEREELLRELEALAEQLRENTGDRSEALAALSEAEQALKDRLDPNADLQRAALDALESKLAALAQQLTEAEPGEVADLEDALDALLDQMGQMDEAEMDNLAKTLQQLAAQAAQAGNSDLAEALSALSQAAQSGDASAAQSAAGEISESAEQAEGELSDQEAIERALSQLQQSRQALSQSGQTASSSQPGQSASGQSNQGQSGQGQSGQGQQPGQGQSGQGQSSGGGGGTNSDSLPPNTGSGQAGAPQGQGQSGQIGSLEEQVTVPWERLQGDNDPLSISGVDTGQGENQVTDSETPLPGSLTPVSVPYQDVYSSYLDSAYQTIDQSYIPSGLKDYVLKYFSQLEPNE
ncbi:MAG TPA: hypothetical protein VJ965_08110 [Anaerolineales bacterium]|nr:hypothetical protein [Anaerolineales bacterium]